MIDCSIDPTRIEEYFDANNLSEKFSAIMTRLRSADSISSGDV